jgi:hypothetical protein
MTVYKIKGSPKRREKKAFKTEYVVLLLIAGCLGIPAAKWALRAPKKSAFVIAPRPVDPEPWDGVGMSDANDRVRVTATSVTTKKLLVVRFKSVEAFLVVALKIENLSPTDALPYSGWVARSDAVDQAATLKDDQGTVLTQYSGPDEIAGQATQDPLRRPARPTTS